MHLKRAIDFHKGLEDDATVNPERMRYIAGCNRQTLSGLEIVEPGRFTYFLTHEGDGRVPHALGLLKDVPTYYVEEDHGSLPKNEKVITAVDQLLERGRTVLLPDRPIAARVALPESTLWHRPVGEYLIGSDLEVVAQRAMRDEATPDEVRVAEEAIMRAVIGENRPARKLPQVKAEPLVNKRPLRVEVVLGDVTQVPAPVVVVGHYKGVTPINAIGAIDKALDGWIRYAVEHSMLGGDLGQVFFIPIRQKQIAAEAVLIAGMGEEGRFSRYDLRYLMLNVTHAISALQVKRVTTILIGAGPGNLSLEHALRSLLFGICDALDRAGDQRQIDSVMLLERDPQRYKDILRTLDKIKTEDSAANLGIKVFKKELPKSKQLSRGQEGGRPENQQKEEFGPRITIERDGDVFRFSALTRNAVIPVRQVEIQSFFPEGIMDLLMASNTKEEQEMYGRLLTTSLMPEDFQQYYDSEQSLTLILDRGTASFPWEMACFGRPEGVAFFGPHLRLTRQFRTLLSSAPGIAPKVNDRLRVLIIADPAPEEELQLPGARDEGREVLRILSWIKQEYALNIEVIDRIGPSECDPIEILGLLLNEAFDVVHFAGHGIFDVKKPSHSGWVFGKEKGRPGEIRTLSAREVFRARRVPNLVFSNACFSAVVNQGVALTAEEMNHNLAGLAEAFFERGVQNYIGAGWPVQDNLAVRFAAEFYAWILVGKSAKALQSEGALHGINTAGSGKREAQPAPLGEALAYARRLILHDGSTWGAYQHYGQADAVLMQHQKKVMTS